MTAETTAELRRRARQAGLLGQGNPARASRANSAASRWTTPSRSCARPAPSCRATGSAARRRWPASAGKRAKSEFDLNKAERQLNALNVTAPSDGIVDDPAQLAVGQLDEPAGLQGRRPRVGGRQHRRAARHLVDVRLGARRRSGARPPGARTRPATVRVEALPDEELKGHIASISALAKADFTSWPPPRNFDVPGRARRARRSAAARA